MTLKSLSSALASVTMAALLGSSPAFAVDKPAGDGLEVVPLRGNLYMVAGPSGNVTVSAGDEGILVVDTMDGSNAEQLLAELRKLSSRPIRYVLNTSANPKQTGGNAVIAEAGSTIAGGNVNAAITDSKSNAAVVAHENVLSTMSAAEPAPPFDGWPTSTYFTPTKDLFFNGEAVQLVHQPNASTGGDSFVWFRRSDVVSAGQIFSLDSYPFIDVKNGGTFLGTLAAINRLIDITVPAARQEGGTLVVPASGRVCDESEVVEYRDMLVLIRNYIQEMIREGRSLDQVKKARPTQAWDERYGKTEGAWTTDMFVETVYRELSKNRGRR